MIDRYDWAGGSEALLRFGPADGPVVAVAMPLFEEANRMRATAVALLRTLAARGIGGILPDLPGQGESLLPTDRATLSGWRAAFASACTMGSRPVVVVSIRSGALLDAEAVAIGRWHLSPQTGAELVRELTRATGNARIEVEAVPDAALLVLQGNRIAPAVLRDLANAVPAPDGPVRIVRLGTDPRPADHRLDAAPPWRRAEPAAFPALAEALADDLAGWVRACAG